MPTIGEDCHITLKHDDVNGGVEYGFVLTPASTRPEGVVIKREVFTEEETPMKIWAWFDVVLADDLINPDGSQHEESMADMYSKLTDYLDQQEEITLAFNNGLIPTLGAIEYAATEQHYPGYIKARIKLTNIGEWFGIIDEEIYNNSVWDGPLTWETSYWT